MEFDTPVPELELPRDLLPPFSKRPRTLTEYHLLPKEVEDPKHHFDSATPLDLGEGLELALKPQKGREERDLELVLV